MNSTATTRTLRALTTHLSPRVARLPARPSALVQARQMSSSMMRPRWIVQQPGSGGMGLAAPAARPLPAHQRTHVRCLASKGGDKSWSEIAAEAAELGKDLVKKVGSSVSKAVEAIVPGEKEEARPARREQERRGREDVYRPEDLGFGGSLVGGLLGRAVGGMLRSAVGAMAEQLQQAAEQVADVQDRAARVIESDSRVRSRLGGSVRVLPPVSQSSMTQSINGRMSKTVTLLMPVVGAGGAQAQAQVQYVEGGPAAEELSVVVRLPSGETVRLDGGSSPAGQTIDVEWRSVDDK